MKTTTSSADPRAFHRLQELIREISVAMITTVTPDGALHSRPMVTADFDDDGSIWFFTADDSGKVHDLAAEHAVNVSYADPRKNHYVSVTGSASIVRDPRRAKELWSSAVKPFFPRGLEDPHLALLAVRVESAEFWDLAAGKMVQLLAATRAAPTGKGPDLGDHTKVEIRATPASG